ncbi:kinetochore protein SPC25 protein [Trifolium repens]|nr:kinetochore protein SPC25 protein [Trifolium repens]
MIEILKYGSVLSVWVAEKKPSGGGGLPAKNGTQVKSLFSGKLKDVEDELLIGTRLARLAVKTHKETKRMALMDVIASAKARVGNLNTSIQDGIYLLVEEFTSILQEALAS